MAQLNRFYILIMLALLTTILISCGEDDSPTTSTTPSPEISGVQPDSAAVGDTVTISGSNFSSTVDANTIRFNETETEAISATDSEIETIVPEGASTGTVKVIIDGSPSNEHDFTVTSLQISSLEPDNGEVGSTVSLHGIQFSSVPDSNIVTFTDGIEAEVTSATETQLEATVPEGAITGPIEITVGEEIAVGPEFTVNYPDPTISSISPESGMIGDNVTISGTNFRTTPDSNTVTFNGAEAEITSATETQLETIVPEDASTGPVEVIAKGDTAIGPTFTVDQPMSIENFEAETKNFENVTAVNLTWEIINPQGKDLICEFDTNGDGSIDHTIDPCSESGSQLWLYRRYTSASQVTPEFNTSSKDGSESASQSLSSSVEISAKLTTDVSADAFQVLTLDNQGHITAWGDGSAKTEVPDAVQDQGIAIATGFNQSFVLAGDNTVTGFGSNGGGQLDVPSSVQGQAIDVSSGSNFGVALKADGTVEAWGGNNNGQLDVPSGLENVVAIVSGEFHTLALKADGTVTAWGWDNHGQSTVPAEFQNGRVVALSAAHASSGVLMFDGSVSAWGRSAVGADTAPSDMGPVIDIAGGGFHQNALQEDGTIRNWGRDKGAVSLDRPGIPNVINISTDFEYGIAIQEDGTVVGWGASGNGGQTDNIPEGLDLIK